MRISVFVATLVFVSASGSRAAPYSSQDSSPLLQIGESTVGEQEFLLYLKETRPEIRFWQLPADQQRRLVEEFAETRALAEMAVRQRLDDEPEVAARLRFFRDRVLAQALRTAESREIEISPTEIAAYYQEHRADFRTADRILLEHLIYSSKRLAEASRGRLREGADWNQLASARSEDPRVIFAERKWFTPDILLEELREAALGLAAGEVADLVQTSYGWHLLRAAEREEGRFLTLDQAEPQIRERLRQAKSTARFRDLSRRALDQFPLKVLDPRLKP